MTNTLSSIVLAIWLAEGGTNASVPYGILSVPVRRIQTYDTTNNRLRLRSQVQSMQQAGSNRRHDTNLHRLFNQGFDRDHARNICERTVVNNYKRWWEAGRPGCFYDYLGNRYVGRDDPRGRVNWKRNVRALLRHQTCNCK